jgi:chemotaxis protein MotA
MKDNWTAIGIGGALGCVFISMFMDGGNPAVLIKPSPLLLVFGGTFFAATAGYMKSDLKSIKVMIKLATKSNVADADFVIQEMARFASLAKTSGILALEKEAKNIEDPFLRRGLELAADGTNSEEMREVLETEISSTEARHRMGAKIFADMGGFAPTLGIIGTVLGLVHVLGSLNDPGSLGPAIGAAFTATLWGVLSANLVWLPISNKLKTASEREVQVKNMMVEGLLSIQSGATSRSVRTKMESFLAASSRPGAEKKEAAA